MAQKRSLYAAPDSFSIAPLLALLPVKGVVGELEKLTSSLYARYEKVLALRKSLGDEVNKETQKRMVAEEAMLRQVLDWLSVKTDQSDHE